jgi:hypothetical protein
MGKYKREAAFIVRETNEAAYLAMVIQNLHKIVLISQIGGKLCVLSLGTWNISNLGKSLPIQVYQQVGK